MRSTRADRRLEEAVAVRTGELQARIAEQSRAVVAAETANRAKGEFLANMSHEIRTATNAVLNLSHLALQSGLNPRQHNYVDKVERSAQALLGIIDDILDFSKIEAGKLDIESVEFELGDVLDSLVSLVGFNAEEKGLELLFSHAPECPTQLTGDPLRLRQILVNLVNNAVKFTEQGEVVIDIVVVERSVSHCVLRFGVHDSGKGIELEQQQRLFRAFEQADASTCRRHGGTGLGLAISQRLAGLMGGRIWAESRPGVGSDFYFTARVGLQPAAATVPPPPAMAAPRTRALVVDANARSAGLLTSTLESFGLEVDSAPDSAAALRVSAVAAAEGRPFEIALIDWKLAGLNGVECARRLQGGGLRSSVVMHTSFAREDVLEAAGALGVDIAALLAKPVLPSTLVDTLVGLLGGSGRVATPPPPARAGATPPPRLERLTGLAMLLVEDNLINQELALELLGAAGLQVTVALDGREALEWLDRRPFDMVLMDCQMPVMDGYEATIALRRQPRFAHLPVIAMTADAMAGQREKVLAAGMSDHISKPIDVDGMFRTLLQWAPARSAAVGSGPR